MKFLYKKARKCTAFLVSTLLLAITCIPYTFAEESCAYLTLPVQETDNGDVVLELVGSNFQHIHFK